MGYRVVANFSVEFSYKISCLSSINAEKCTGRHNKDIVASLLTEIVNWRVSLLLKSEQVIKKVYDY